MLYNKRVALDFLGKVCSDLNLLRDRKYLVNEKDFDDRLHKIIYAVLQDMALEHDMKEVDGITIDSYLTGMDKQQAIFRQSNGVELIDTLKKVAENTSADYSYRTLKKYSLLRSYASKGMDITDILNENLVDIAKLEEQRKRFDTLTLEDIKKHYKSKIIDVEEEFKDSTGESYAFEGGDSLEELITRCEESPLWGKSFQSKYLNAIYRGMIPTKYFIRSAGTGGSKTRQALADLCNLTVDMLFDEEQNKWVKNYNGGESALFITTELTQDECQLAMLAFVSAVDEEIIKNGNGTDEQKARIRQAVPHIKNANIYIEFITDFTVDDIENIIEKNIIRNNVGFVFFDYLQLTPSLAASMNKSFGNALREDQILANFSAALKNICNAYNVFLATSTQLNRSYKQDGEPDPTHLRGGMSTADKCDMGQITMRVGAKELERVQPILSNGFANKVPNLAHYIYKNRGGSRTGVIVWTQMNLNNIREKDCFVTNLDYELISDITPVNLVDRSR
ncbi:DnaB-like helicase C-terminal domain-containing protein [Clostridium sp.]|uniref:DnaB-like helicase C-terminal domain-containing protein n=1 Tax=Clostridium sp. TaxID=1506 RepID=UPI002FCB0F29